MPLHSDQQLSWSIHAQLPHEQQDHPINHIISISSPRSFNDYFTFYSVYILSSISLVHLCQSPIRWHIISFFSPFLSPSAQRVASYFILFAFSSLVIYLQIQYVCGVCKSTLIIKANGYPSRLTLTSPRFLFGGLSTLLINFSMFDLTSHE